MMQLGGYMAAIAENYPGVLNEQGDTPSRLDPSKILSYNRWSITIVYAGTVSDALRVSNPSTPGANWSSRFISLLAHARIILEQVTPGSGYKVFDCDLIPLREELGGKKYSPTCYDGHVRIFHDLQRTLGNMQGSMGTLIKNSDKIEKVINYLIKKRDDSRNYSERKLLGYRPRPPFFFDLEDPNPENNTFNCITLTFEAAKAGGIDFYALYADGERLIPRVHIRKIEDLVDKAVDGDYPLNKELKEYIANYENESTKRVRGMNKTILDMTMLGDDGPLALVEYRKMEQAEGRPTHIFHQDLMDAAHEEVRKSPLLESLNVLGALGSNVPLLLTLPPAMAIQSVVTSVVGNNKKKEAAKRFFEEEP